LCEFEAYNSEKDWSEREPAALSPSVVPKALFRSTFKLQKKGPVFNASAVCNENLTLKERVHFSSCKTWKLALENDLHDKIFKTVKTI